MHEHKTSQDHLRDGSSSIDQIDHRLTHTDQIDLDAVVSLALFQEGALDICKRKEPQRADVLFPYTKGVYRVSSGATLFHDRQTNWYPVQHAPVIAEDKRGIEASRQGPAPPSDNRAAALKSYRHSLGLCFMCGDKYSPVQKCATSVQLHVVQEILDALGLDNLSKEEATVTSPGAQLLIISEAAVARTEARNTFHLLGQIQKHQVLMLIDFGSSHCFVSETMAAKLHGVEQATTPITVKLADGSLISCAREFIGCEWWCHRATLIRV
jgi:hypothetical protein